MPYTTSSASYHPAAASASQPQQQARHPSSAAPGPSASSPPASIPDTNLGLTRDDVAALRQHQHLAHQNARSSAGSQASSQGRLLLDPTSLGLLVRHLERVMAAIQQRLEQLNRATEIATQAQFDRAGNVIAMADAEIARFRAILRTIDELETEFDKLRRLQEIVRGFRARVEAMERRMG